MPRFATQQQIDIVAAQGTNIAIYQAKFDGIITAIAGWIEAISPSSGIETRFITGEGRDDENWRGHLLSASLNPTKVDLWCLSLTMTEGLPATENEIGAFNKPISLAVDYFYDYDFGTDAANSEAVFNKRVNAFDFILEQIRGNSSFECLPNDCTIESWMSRRLIKRFTNASTHIAKTDISLRFEGL